MNPGNYNFTIQQGTKFSRVLTWKDSAGSLVNLTGYTAEMRIKSEASDPVEVITLSTTPDEDGNGITLGGAAGTITLLIKSATTDAMDFNEADYDLDLIDASDEPTRLLKGTVSLSRET